RPPWVWPSVGVGVLVLGLFAAWLGGVIRVKTPEGVIVLENVPKDAEVFVDGRRVTLMARHRQAAGDPSRSGSTQGGSQEGRIQDVRRHGDPPSGRVGRGQSAASPCLGSVDVTPWRTRLDFPDCHYITVSSPSGGVGGFRSVNFNAFRTRRASGQPPLTPRRSGRSSMRNVTKRTVCSVSIARSAEKSIPASSSRRASSRCTKSARAA